MKFLVLSVLLLGACTTKQVPPPEPASKPVEEKRLSIRKFYVNYLKTADQEDDCVYLDSREDQKSLHFMFVCGDRLVHLGFLK